MRQRLDSAFLDLVEEVCRRSGRHAAVVNARRREILDHVQQVNVRAGLPGKGTSITERLGTLRAEVHRNQNATKIRHASFNLTDDGRLSRLDTEFFANHSTRRWSLDQQLHPTV
jgi:hypothetical protein